KINYPLSLALSLELENKMKLRIETFSNDDSILFLFPKFVLDESPLPVRGLFTNALASLDKPDSGGITRGERLFRSRLESSGVFGANFREAAERSLLLPKAGFGKRTPLWIMRQRSRRLFDTVAGEDGFPAITEAWRTCLVDIFDMNGYRDFIAAINSGEVTLTFFRSVEPSPFSRDVVRQEVNTLMYEYDERKDLLSGSRGATLSDKVINDAIGSAALRPVLKSDVTDSFSSRLRREISGWAPEDRRSLSEWVKERIAIPVDEWDILVRAAGDKAEIDNERIITVTRKGDGIASMVHREWLETWSDEPLSLLGLWLRREGPVSMERIRAVFGVNYGEAEDAVDALIAVDEAVRDVSIQNETGITQNLVCDRENLEMLLRLSRKKERPVIKERPLSLLVPFLAMRQGLAPGNENSGSSDRLTSLITTLSGWSAPAKLWETEILCARSTGDEPRSTNSSAGTQSIAAYRPEIIDCEIREGRIVWYGTGKERVSFCHPEDLDLVTNIASPGQITDNPLKALLASAFFNRPHDFWEIKDELEKSISINSNQLAEALWSEVWHGRLSSDSFYPVRKGLEFGFIPRNPEIPQTDGNVFRRTRRIPGAIKNRWKSGSPVHGNWFSLVMDEQDDPLEEDTLNRDRVRLLLKRWGVLCRPLLENEASVFSWSKLLPAIRRMELAGELIAGRFFSGINSLQFASSSIAAELEQAENFNGIYWMNAQDPASPAGLDIEGLGYSLCARTASNRLYFRGSRLIAISVKNGRELQIFIKPGEPYMPELIALFKIPRTRSVLPENKIAVDKINGQIAAQSEYAPYLKSEKFIYDRGKLILW
ncbi:MAG: hypothetical protein LBB81_06270, partial [Treponema sp.]|nr:hypothetical protein [Treponema sp.]